jgi:hypothetical protein
LSNKPLDIEHVKYTDAKTSVMWKLVLCCGQMATVPASYLEHPRSWPGGHLPQLRFFSFPQFLHVNGGTALQHRPRTASISFPACHPFIISFYATQVELMTTSLKTKQNKKNSVALSPWVNYTDWATATCWRNLANFCG